MAYFALYYDSRYPFASQLVMSGVDLPTVQALMGYKDICMTPRYMHLPNDHKQGVVYALESSAEKPYNVPHSTETRDIMPRKPLNWAAPVAQVDRAVDS